MNEELEVFIQTHTWDIVHYIPETIRLRTIGYIKSNINHLEVLRDENFTLRLKDLHNNMILYIRKYLLWLLQ